MSPLPLVSRTLSILHRAQPPAADQLARILPEAGRIFLEGDLDGLSLEVYQSLVARTSGLSISTVAAASGGIARALGRVAAVAMRAAPESMVDSWDLQVASAGGPRWVRRGSVFSVLTAGNHPGTHIAWLQALALGYRVAVRPSRKEPFTPHRLVAALRRAGIDDDQLVLLPCDYAGADELVAGADLAMVYGGDEVMHKYESSRRVLPQGPGRSKVLITRDADRESALRVAADSIVHGGGTSCMNASAILVEEDAEGFARDLAERLAQVDVADPLDSDAVLPVLAIDAAQRMATALDRYAEGARRSYPVDGIVATLTRGTAALRPGITLLDSSDDPRCQIELPFAHAWVAPWSPANGLEPLRESLVLTAMTDDTALLDALVNEPSIRNVYAGNVPTYWSAPGVPHDGFLADFLMESKGVRRLAA
jgi:hypothetical protein